MTNMKITKSNSRYTHPDSILVVVIIPESEYEIGSISQDLEVMEAVSKHKNAAIAAKNGIRVKSQNSGISRYISESTYLAFIGS